MRVTWWFSAHAALSVGDCYGPSGLGIALLAGLPESVFQGVGELPATFGCSSFSVLKARVEVIDISNRLQHWLRYNVSTAK